MNWKLVIAGALTCALAAVAWARRTRVPPAHRYDIGSYKELTGRIRAGSADSKSECELGPANSDGQAAWLELQEPRALGAVPFSALLNERDSKLWLELTSRLLDKRNLVGLGAMSEAEQNVTLIDELQGEVMNGGFHQYFANSSGNCAGRARRAAHAIGPELSALVEAAFSVFPGANPAEDRATRNAQMTSLPDEWSAWSHFDDEFYKLSLDEALARYIRTHAGSFDCPTQSLPPKK